MNEMQQKAAERRQAEVNRAWAAVLGTPEGRFVLYEILDRGHIYDPDISVEPHTAQRVLGRRDVALSLLGDIMAINPTLYARMCDEYREFTQTYGDGSVNEEEDDG